MTKQELLEKIDVLLAKKGMEKILTFDGKVDMHCTKAEIEDAIRCLECSDEEMYHRLAIVKKELPNTYRIITDNVGWLTNSFSRYYVFSTARNFMEVK